MPCSGGQRTTLFAVYVIAISVALANPAKIEYTDAYHLTQAANVATLLIMAYCRRSSNDVAVAAGLGAALAMRVSGGWQGGSRWDSLLVAIGVIVVLHRVFEFATPASIPHRTLLYCGFSCVIMPILAALPHIGTRHGVDEDTLRNALVYSNAAYGVKPGASDVVGGPAWTLYDAATDTRAGVTRVTGKDRSDLYVYFAGSSSLENWKTNSNVLAAEVPGEWGCGGSQKLKTHRGYQKAFNSVSSQMLAAVQAMVQTGSDERIVCVGHSLGGALASMAAMFVACKVPALRSRVVVVSFGAPQVGDGAFVRAFNDLVPVCVRVVNPLDPVPRLLNVQLVQVKGYYPVGVFSLAALVNSQGSHSMEVYGKSLDLPPTFRVVAAFFPAVLAALVVGGYIAWKLP